MKHEGHDGHKGKKEKTILGALLCAIGFLQKVK